MLSLTYGTEEAVALCRAVVVIKTAVCCGVVRSCVSSHVSVQDVMQFTYGAEASLKRRKRQDGSTEYTVVARHNPITGRIEAETGEEESLEPLYKECLSWCNPVEFEKYLEQVSLVYAVSYITACAMLAIVA